MDTLDYLFEQIPHDQRPEDFEALAAVWYGLGDDQRSGASMYGELLLDRDYGYLFHYLRIASKPITEYSPGPNVVEEPVADVAPVKKGRRPTQLSLLSPYPTSLARCSCFFPVGEKELVEFEIDNPWGTLKFKGPRLNMSHCDLLVVILAAAADKGKRKEEEIDGEITYTYHGSLRELLVAKGNKNPNSRDYDAAFDLLEDMAGAVFSYRRKGDQEVSDKKEPRRVFAPLLTGGKKYDDGTFSVSVNPFFVEKLIHKQVTWLDIVTRNKIRSPYTKALHLFFSTQSDSWRSGIEPLARAINMPEHFSRSEIREKLRNAIAEMIKIGDLDKNSHVQGNVVHLLKPKKAAKK